MEVFAPVGSEEGEGVGDHFWEVSLRDGWGEAYGRYWVGVFMIVGVGVVGMLFLICRYDFMDRD